MDESKLSLFLPERLNRFTKMQQNEEISRIYSAYVIKPLLGYFLNSGFLRKREILYQKKSGKQSGLFLPITAKIPEIKSILFCFHLIKYINELLCLHFTELPGESEYGS